jgi:hypothetical protein
MTVQQAVESSQDVVSVVATTKIVWERGFSVNRQTETENSTEESFIVKRICSICWGNWKTLMWYARNCYWLHPVLDRNTACISEEVMKKSELMETKKRAVGEDIDETKKKKQRLEQDMFSWSISWCFAYLRWKLNIPSSMSLRSTVCAELQLKSDELKTVELQLDTLLQQVRKNSTRQKWPAYVRVHSVL